MLKKAIIMASALGMLAVVLGAFGAHGLKKIVNETDIVVWNKGVFYQFIHTFSILLVGIISQFHTHPLLSKSINLFFIGVVLFSGSLYLLTFKNVCDFGVAVKIIGPITPVGGLLFVAGWICLLLAGIKIKENGK